MKLIIDMSLSPIWEEALRQAGYDAKHWSRLGEPHAPDAEILRRAQTDGAVVLTHDLDFGAILALTGMESPSVVQVRTTNPVPAAIGASLLDALARSRRSLNEGALVVVEPARARVRVLPLRRTQ